ncbi:hypothetical protein RH858_01675 [Halalkaliarchaeum sp. AArc-GB]|uniref:hypothetical protein n=1 Tax=Halalkaliarchaeum sp. AArc-GB TaxID=3074078 RepID=UPI002856B170|nr:hypothetical protein [Halalkaliarchaeum sp. AArc-GB]MDR5671864.1 hypothetical protein [Halalkaliarchaeum sp. AArc-GB]
MVVILTSYVSIGLGIVLLALGLYLRSQKHEQATLVLGIGTVLVLFGLALLAWFMRAFS